MASWIIQENKLILRVKQSSENPLTSFRSNQRPIVRVVQMIGAFTIVKESGESHFIHGGPRHTRVSEKTPQEHGEIREEQEKCFHVTVSTTSSAMSRVLDPVAGRHDRARL